jgi:WhiB family transcriptional regulator, redox-sensing transcriptional regulator
VHELNAAWNSATDNPAAATPAADDVHQLFPARTLMPTTAPGFELAYTGEDEELSWQEQALCAQTDPEAFFPEKGGSTRDAKKICMSCPVRAECLEYALAHDERFGIWGGLSERERRRLKKQAG